MRTRLMLWPMQSLLTLLLLVQLNGTTISVAAETATSSRPSAWRIVLCMAETQLGEGDGTECVVVVRNTTDAPLPVRNLVNVKQCQSPVAGKPATELDDGSRALQPATAPADPRIAEFMELWAKTARIVVTIEGAYTASYVRPTIIGDQGLMQRVEVRPEQPYYRGVNLPGSLFQTGQYRLRAALIQGDQVLADSNIQVVYVTKAQR